VQQGPAAQICANIESTHIPAAGKVLCIYSAKLTDQMQASLQIPVELYNGKAQL